MTHLWWRAITENDRFRPTYRGRRPIVRHAGRAPAENPCPNLLRRNGPPDPLGNVKAAAISDKFRETTGSFRSAPLTRLSGGAPSHQPTSFVRSDTHGTNPEFRFAGPPRRRGGGLHGTRGEQPDRQRRRARTRGRTELVRTQVRLGCRFHPCARGRHAAGRTSTCHRRVRCRAVLGAARWRWACSRRHTRRASAA